MAEELVSVNWRRPGIVQVVVSRKYLTKEKDTGAAVGLKGLFSGVDMRLIESHVKMEGAYSVRYSKYEGAVALASPAAVDGPIGEKETWGAEVVLEQRDLAKHPQIESILEAGKGKLVQGKVVWAPKIEVDGEFVRNPFFGVSSYLSPRFEVTREKYEGGDGKISGSALLGLGWLDNAMDYFDFMLDERFILDSRTINRGGGGRVTRVKWVSREGLVDPVYDEDWDG
jgi:hypothetical protein